MSRTYLTVFEVELALLDHLCRKYGRAGETRLARLTYFAEGRGSSLDVWLMR